MEAALSPGGTPDHEHCKSPSKLTPTLGFVMLPERAPTARPPSLVGAGAPATEVGRAAGVVAAASAAIAAGQDRGGSRPGGSCCAQARDERARR